MFNPPQNPVLEKRTYFLPNKCIKSINYIYSKWSPLYMYVYSMNPSQYCTGQAGDFLRKVDRSDRSLVIYIVLFIYGVNCRVCVPCPGCRVPVWVSDHQRVLHGQHGDPGPQPPQPQPRRGNSSASINKYLHLCRS